MEFAQHYYTCLSREPTRLPSFYTKNATLLHGSEGDLDLPVSVGTEAIQSTIAKSPFTGCRFIIQNIDCHPSLNGGIMINVLGQVQQGKSALPAGTRSFAQSFFLVEQPQGYFVLNDNMRLLSAVNASSSASGTTASASANANTASTEVKPEVKAVVEEPKVTNDDVTTATAQPTTTQPITTAQPAQPTTTTTQSNAQTESKPVKKVTTKASAAAKASSKSASDAPTSPTASTASAASTEEQQLSPSGPSSWAQLAAVQQSKWASGVVAPAKGTSIVESPSIKKRVEEKPRSVSNVQSNGQSNAQSVQRPQSSTAQQPTQSNQSSQQKKIPFVPEAALYVTGVTEAVKTDSLKSAFSALGSLAHFDVYRKNGAAFVEYADPAIAKLVLEDGKMVVDGVTLTVEKRRVNNNGGSSSAAKKDNEFNRISNGRRRNTNTNNQSA